MAMERRVRPGIFSFSRPLVRALERAGFECWVVTGVLEPLASMIAAEMGVSRVLATPLAVGAGRVRGPAGIAFPTDWKALRAHHLLSDPGVDLALSAAFGDSGADLSLMERVGLPVAVRPKPSLREVAERRAYAVLDPNTDAPDVDSMATWLRAQAARAAVERAARRA